MALTHAAIASVGVSFILGTVDPLVMGLAIIGSQLPDIDSSSSIIGQMSLGLAKWIENRYPHRSITHSFLATGVLAIASMGASYLLVGNLFYKPAIAIPLAHLLTILSDTFTKQGVQLFWPQAVWCVMGMNPRRRLRTGGTGEYWVLAAALTLCFVSYQIHSDGQTIGSRAGQSLGLKDAIVSSYNANAGSNQMWANVTGVWASDRSDASGKYLIIDSLGGTNFTLIEGTENPRQVYKTGSQIVVDKISLETGDPATTKIEQISWDDEETLLKLQNLASMHPNALIFLSGNIEIDFPEDVAIAFQPNELQTLRVSGMSVTLEYCPVEVAIAHLRDQWAIGSIQAKIITSPQ